MTYDRPPLPDTLNAAPMYHGMAVPYITKWHAGQPMWGQLDAAKVRRVLLERLCQTCGRPLRQQAVLHLRPSDYQRRLAGEPPMHPACAAYSRRACPMLSGRMTHYSKRVRGQQAHCSDPTCECAMWAPPAAADIGNAGHRADDWYELWLLTDQLRIVADIASGVPDRLAVDLRGIVPRKISPIRVDPDRAPNILDAAQLFALLCQ